MNMKKLTLNIDENRFATFLSFIKTLDYVSVAEEEDIPRSQKDEVNKRIEQVQNGDMKTRSWEEAKEDIFKR